MQSDSGDGQDSPPDVDDPDGDRIAQLTERVDQLQRRAERAEAMARATVDTLDIDPSKRKFLKTAGVAGAIGVAGASGYATGKAEAADTSVGTVGATGSPVDVINDEVRDTGNDVVLDIDDTGDLNWNNRGFDNVSSLDGADFANAASGEVPKSDGAGGLTMGTVGGNVPSWSEDANSPLTVTSSTSGTITLNGTYDAVMGIVLDGDATQYDIRVNSDSGSNYDYLDISGASTSGATEWGPMGRLDAGRGTIITISGRWNTKCGISNLGRADFSSRVFTGTNQNVTSPLNSITALSGSSFNMTMRVYGLN